MPTSFLENKYACEHITPRVVITIKEFTFDKLHGIENGKTGNDRSTGGVDVEVNWFRAIFFVEVEHYTDDLVGKFVVNFGSQEDDTLSVKTVVNVNPDFIFDGW